MLKNLTSTCAILLALNATAYSSKSVNISYSEEEGTEVINATPRANIVGKAMVFQDYKSKTKTFNLIDNDTINDMLQKNAHEKKLLEEQELNNLDDIVNVNLGNSVTSSLEDEENNEAVPSQTSQLEINRLNDSRIKLRSLMSSVAIYDPAQNPEEAGNEKWLKDQMTSQENFDYYIEVYKGMLARHQEKEEDKEEVGEGEEEEIIT